MESPQKMTTADQLIETVDDPRFGEIDIVYHANLPYKCFVKRTQHSDKEEYDAAQSLYQVIFAVAVGSIIAGVLLGVLLGWSVFCG